MANNAYQKGYNDGYQAAINKRGKSFLKMGRQLLSLNPSFSMDQYSEGYNAGYAQGTKDVRNR